MIYLFNKKMQGKEADKKLPFHVFPSACLSGSAASGSTRKL